MQEREKQQENEDVYEIYRCSVPLSRRRRLVYLSVVVVSISVLVAGVLKRINSCC
jgi:hypothetical protein